MAQKKNRLRELSKAPPTPPEIQKLMKALDGEADFAVAITAGALLETALERLIVAKLKRHSKKSLEELFGFNGPMGTFSSKIQIADAFGLISSNMARELHVIRNLRNAFAHSRVPLTFANPLIESELKGMIIPTTIREHAQDMALKGRSNFLLTTRILLILLEVGLKGNSSPDGISDQATGSQQSHDDEGGEAGQEE